MTEPTGPRRAARQRPEPIELPGIVPVAPVRMSDDLADQIRRLILSEDVSEGARLPSERDLAERSGVEHAAARQPPPRTW